MTKHEDGQDARLREKICVLGERRTKEVGERVLPRYDATAHVGLNAVVYDAAIERVDKSGEETIELPKPRELRASVAVARCLMPIKLRGWGDQGYT